MTTPFQNMESCSIPKYMQDSCGVCEKPIEYCNESVSWVNPMSRTAHKCCYEKIKNSEKMLHEYVTSVFKKTIKVESQRDNWCNKTSSYARGCIKELCKGTILSYLEKSGQDKLTQVYNEIGCAAAEKYILSHLNDIAAIPKQ